MTFDQSREPCLRELAGGGGSVADRWAWARPTGGGWPSAALGLAIVLGGCSGKAPGGAERNGGGGPTTEEKANGGGEAKAEAEAGAGDESKTEAGAKADAGAAAEADRLMVLSGRKEALVGPLLAGFRLQGAEPGADSGGKGDGGVQVDYGDTAALAMRLIAEGERSGGDVVLAQEVGYLGSLGVAGLLAEVPAEVSGQVGEAFRDPKRMWVGVSGRLRVLVHGRARPAAPKAEAASAGSIGPGLGLAAGLPATLKELADPRFRGRLGWAPGNASMHAHLSVLRHLWGEAETETWLKGMIANGAKAYPKNSPQVRAAADGAIELGWVNHYYLHKLGLTDKASNYSFPTRGDAGNVVMVSGVAVLKSAKNPDAAWKFVNYLLRRDVQERIAKELYEYPARTGVAPHSDVPPLEGIGLAKFDVNHLADVGPTLAMLRKLGLQ